MPGYLLIPCRAPPSNWASIMGLKFGAGKIVPCICERRKKPLIAVFYILTAYMIQVRISNHVRLKLLLYGEKNVNLQGRTCSKP